jgi:hypothetical protein
MSKTDGPTHLPAPLSLTLEEASKVAAGSAVVVLPEVPVWWWKGQPINFGTLVNTVTLPSNTSVGPTAVA